VSNRNVANGSGGPLGLGGHGGGIQRTILTARWRRNFNNNTYENVGSIDPL